MANAKILACIACALALAAPVSASNPIADFSTMQVVELHNGPNAIDIDGDGQQDVAFLAHRENYNAHSFEHVTFYHHQDTSSQQQSGEPEWNVVPFFADGQPELDALDTVQGADCRLRDWVVLRMAGNKPSPLTVIVADRDLGETYVDSKPVTFSVYRLERHPGQVPGDPEISFSRVARFRSHGLFCDADDAIRTELGIKLKSAEENNDIARLSTASPAGSGTRAPRFLAPSSG